MFCVSPSWWHCDGPARAFVFAVQSDPGLGATVQTPPTWVLIAGWVVGILALAILWAVSRR